MYNLIWTVLTTKSHIDQETNNISLIDCLETIQIKLDENTKTKMKEGFLAVPFAYELVSLISREESDMVEEVKGKVEYVDPNNKKIGETDFVIKFDVGLSRMRQRVRFNTLTYTVDGNYCFIVKLEDQGITKIVSETPLNIKGV